MRRVGGFGPVHVSSGILLVALGAALWGTDALIRRGLALDMPSSTLVFLEHLVLVVVVSPVLVRSVGQLRKLTGRDWVAPRVIGAGSPALATVQGRQSVAERLPERFERVTWDRRGHSRKAPPVAATSRTLPT